MSVPSLSKEVLDLTKSNSIYFFDFINYLFLELEIGECSNQLINIICQNLKHLTKLAFNGENITYSGVAGLVGQKDYLKSLSIKFEYSEKAVKFEKQGPNFISNYLITLWYLLREQGLTIQWTVWSGPALLP